MFTKTTIALAIAFGAASGALAAPKHPSVATHNDVFDARGGYQGADPDTHIRFELRRDENVRPN